MTLLGNCARRQSKHRYLSLVDAKTLSRVIPTSRRLGLVAVLCLSLLVFSLVRLLYPQLPLDTLSPCRAWFSASLVHDGEETDLEGRAPKVELADNVILKVEYGAKTVE